MHQYPVLNQVWRVLRRTVWIAGGFCALVVGAECLRIFLLFRRISPIVALAFAAVLIILLLVAVAKVVRYLADRRTLRAPAAPPPGDLDFHRLHDYCKFLVHYLKRLSDHLALAPELRQRLRQQAYDLEDVLHAHPLADDLSRALNRTREDFLDPALAEIRHRTQELARARMRSVVQDVIEPPFPVIHWIVVFYHQLMLICSITDRYLTGPGLMEYYAVVRDTWLVLTRGDFLHIGQRLFEGIYANSPPMGQGADDVGEALTSIWLTVIVSEAAMQRCSALTAWTVKDAIKDLDRRTVECLKVTREELISEVMPMLKLRFRHSVPPGVADAAGFTDALSGGIEKAIDLVVKGLRLQPPEKTAQDSRRTQPGVLDARGLATGAEAEEGRRRRSHHTAGRSPRRGLLGMFRTFGQRLQYGMKGSRLHR